VWLFRFYKAHPLKTPSMKANLRTVLLLPFTMLIATAGRSQTVPDQNPNYLISEAKYANMADSLNSLHGTTPQETYKAIDWMADRQEAREQRRAFRRQLRMERARYGWYYNDYSSYSYPGYYGGNYNYYYQPYHNYRSGYRYRYNNYQLIPLAYTLGWWLSR
jgi:hypothetical protein